MTTSTPEGHPEIDWSKWEAPGEGDVRSPCPMLNALANHHILPHSGKGVTKEMAVSAISSSINLSPTLAGVFAGQALTTNPNNDKSATTTKSFDLDHVNKHGPIEHDVSLSRNDVNLGDNHTFDKERFERYLSTYGDRLTTDFKLASKARFDRFLESKKAHEAEGKDFTFGIKEFILSYGETALFLSLLGDPKDGRIPLEYIRVLFEEERLPYKEGWRPNTKTVTQSDMNHLIYSLFMANDRKFDEVKQVGWGTMAAVVGGVGALASKCNVM